MSIRRKAALALSAAMLGSLFSTAVAIAPAEASTRPAWTKNCAAANKKFPHGVGRTNAVDKTSGAKVRNFRKSNPLYKTAMNWNRGLDRDKDGIACEKR